MRVARTILAAVPAFFVVTAGAQTARQATGQFGVSITILPPQSHGTVSFQGEVVGPGSKIDGSGDVVGYYTEPGCYVVQLRGWTSRVIACGAERPLIGIGRPVIVRGDVTGTARQRQGPYLDVAPVVRGSTSRR